MMSAASTISRRISSRSRQCQIAATPSTSAIVRKPPESASHTGFCSATEPAPSWRAVPALPAWMGAPPSRSATYQSSRVSLVPTDGRDTRKRIFSPSGERVGPMISATSTRSRVVRRAPAPVSVPGAGTLEASSVAAITIRRWPAARRFGLRHLPARGRNRCSRPSNGTAHRAGPCRTDC